MATANIANPADLQAAPAPRQMAPQQAAALQLIAGLNAENKRLGAQNIAIQMKANEDAAALEQRLFKLAQDKQNLQGQINRANADLLVREQQLQELRAQQQQNAEHIALRAQEVAALTLQLEQGRQRVQVLSDQLNAATAQINQLTAQVAELTRLHRETLLALRQQKPAESSTIAGIVGWVFSSVENGLKGFPARNYS
jgi:chromosome segregation ATPase